MSQLSVNADPEIDIIFEILSNIPTILTIEPLLDTILSKISFKQFLTYLIHNIKLYDNFRNKQQYWEKYARNHLDEYFSVPYHSKSEINWFDFVCGNIYEYTTSEIKKVFDKYKLLPSLNSTFSEKYSAVDHPTLYSTADWMKFFTIENNEIKIPAAGIKIHGDIIIDNQTRKLSEKSVKNFRKYIPYQSHGTEFYNIEGVKKEKMLQY